MLAAASITKIITHRTASVFMLEEIHEAIASAKREMAFGAILKRVQTSLPLT